MKINVYNDEVNAFIRDNLAYCSDTGDITWKVSGPGRRFDKKAGTITADGYRTIGVLRRMIFAHRLVFFLMTGEWPIYDVDHINGNKLDNRWCNLRICSRSDNLSNMRLVKKNTSGVKGVSWESRREKWIAKTQFKSKHYFVGYFDDIEDAKKAIQAKTVELKGEFARFE